METETNPQAKPQPRTRKADTATQLREADNESILKQITTLHGMTIKTLKERYLTLLPESPPPPANKAFLIRRIAYKLQEDAFGGLPTQAQERLEVLKTELNPLGDLRGGSTKAIRRIPLPGSTITKIYKGKSIEVKVLHKGFEYAGKPYRSLSRIAHEVSGVHQSGFVFFGL